MTKIFSAVFFAILLIGTWVVVNNRPAVTYQTHADMQATVLQIVTTQLSKEKPNARNFAIHELKSQSLSDNAVRVTFRYEFEEPDVNGTYAKIQRAGQVELMRAASQEAGAPEMWQLREGQVLTSETLIIQDEQRVTPGEGESPADVPTMAPNAGAAASTGTPAEASTGTPTATPTPVAAPSPGQPPVGNTTEN